MNRDGRYGLTYDERRVMAYFAKHGSERDVAEIVRGVERGVFLVNPRTWDIKYPDKDDVLKAVVGLLQKGLLYEKGRKYGVTVEGKTKHIGTYLSARTRNQRNYLKKNRKHTWKVVVAGSSVAAALIYITSQVLTWLNP